MRKSALKITNVRKPLKKEGRLLFGRKYLNNTIAMHLKKIQ